jgi:hypothetical protein
VEEEQKRKKVGEQGKDLDKVLALVSLEIYLYIMVY